MSAGDIKHEMLAAQADFRATVCKELLDIEGDVQRGAQEACSRGEEAQRLLTRIVRANLPTFQAYAADTATGLRQVRDRVAGIAESPADQANPLVQHILNGTDGKAAKLDEMGRDADVMKRHAEVALGHLAAFFEAMNGFDTAYQDFSRHYWEALESGRRVAFGFEAYIEGLG